MQEKIERVKAEEFCEVIRFMNKAFGENFPRLIPKLYDNHPEQAQNHIVISCAGRPVAAIATIPVLHKLGSFTLKGCGVGMVSVGKAARGKGYMGKLMAASIEEAKTRHDADFMFLTGMRQRYEYFGFVPAGVMHHFRLCKNNVLHTKVDTCYEFLPLEKNLSYLKDMYALYEKETHSWQRDEASFYDIIRGWKYTARVILKDSKFFGFCVLSSVCEEILIIDKEEIVAVACSLYKEIKKGKGDLVFLVPHYQKTYLLKLTALCEQFWVEQNCSIKILKYANVIEAFMNDTISTQTLVEGSVRIKIGEVIYEISIEKGLCKVKEIALGHTANIQSENGKIVRGSTQNETFDVEWDEKQAVVMLCSYNGVSFSNALLRAWGVGGGGLCPISLPHIDNV